MTAADNLARWREAERGATEGPWHTCGAWSRLYVLAPLHSIADLGYIDEDPGLPSDEPAKIRRDATFIATAREAMAALLAFAEAVLALADDHIEGYVNVNEVDRLAEQHLTTSSTPTTGERSVEPAAVTGSGRTADTGGLDSPGVGTSTTKEQS